MYPVQRGLYNHRSTMNQFAKPGQQFTNMAVDPYPFTNANLTDLSPKSSSVNNNNNNSAIMQQQYGDSSEDFFDQDMSNNEDFTISNMSTKKSLSKAERRAEHNAIERARREILNSKFQSLAQALPNLLNYRRPSKSQIIEKALDWVKQSLSREERYRYQILLLQRENKRLLAQLMPQQQQQQENIPPATTTAAMAPPTPRHSMSTPTTRSTSNASPSSSPMMYPSSSTTTDFNGWSNQVMQQQVHSNEDLLITAAPARTTKRKRPAGSRNEEEENISSSSGNEDDFDYQSSPINKFINSPPQQPRHQFLEHQQCLMVPEAYRFPATESYFVDSVFMNNYQKYSSSQVLTNSAVSFDPAGLGGKSSHPTNNVHMISY